jgi:hypothetical protein
MSLNTYSVPRVIIGDTPYENFSGLSYTDSGNSTVTNMRIVLTDPKLETAAFFNKEVKVYLDYGSIDEKPFFRGFIKEVTPREKVVNIVAYDVLSFLTGRESLPLKITDKNNYDGYTLTQFLHEYISTYINVTETVIGLDFLNETDPVITMSGFRDENGTDVLSIVNQLKGVLSDDLDDILNYNLGVVHGSNYSNIIFYKDEPINSHSSTLYSYNEGINKITYKTFPNPNIAFISDENNISFVYKDNNIPVGTTSLPKTDTKFTDTNSALEQAYIAVRNFENNSKEISLTTNRGIYLEKGNIVKLSIPEVPQIHGAHRIVSKKIDYKNKGLSCTLGLNKAMPLTSTYL